MSWTEVCLETDAEAAEAAATLLNRWAQGGAVIEVPVDCLESDLPDRTPDLVRVKAYLPAGPEGAEPRRQVEEALWHLGQLYPLGEPVFRDLADEDWAEAWKREFGLVRVSPRLVIAPTWQSYAPLPGEVVIRLEPGLAFGTGLHPTTRLCLLATERHLRPGGRVLDVGTGSGILAVGAALLGAGRVVALDVDPVAVRVARENVALNGMAGRVQVEHGSLIRDERLPPRLTDLTPGRYPVWEAGQFDLVLVNILAPVIVAMSLALAAHLAPAGTLVAAGLIETQEAEVTAALAAHGLRPVDRWQEKDWVVLALRHGQSLAG